MRYGFLQLLYNAATLLAAFFLCPFSFGQLNVAHVSGKVESISDKESELLSINTVGSDSLLSYNDLICTAKGSRTEFSTGSDTVVRLGSMSVLSVLNDNSFILHSGSMLLANTEPKDIYLSSADSNATFSGSGTILIETTQNGGFKFIPFEGRGFLKTESGETHEVKGGRLVLVLNNPSRLGDAYDIDLMLLIKTSRLINSFPEPLETFGRISLAVYSQELKLKGKYNALIGDAPTNDNLQVWAFGERESEK